MNLQHLLGHLAVSEKISAQAAHQSIASSQMSFSIYRKHPSEYGTHRENFPRAQTELLNLTFVFSIIGNLRRREM